MKFYCEDKDKVLAEVNATSEGLSSLEAERCLEENGRNKLAAAKGKSLLRRFLEQLADPMTIILLVAAAISGVLAVVENESFADVIIILAVVIINAVLGVYQESKAEKAIEALQEMSAATSLKNCGTVLEKWFRGILQRCGRLTSAKRISSRRAACVTVGAHCLYGISMH